MKYLKNREGTDWVLLFSAWVISVISMLGSLFFSEVMLFTPCILCWYQRICMYPLVLILLPSLLSFDYNVVKYCLPLTSVGWLISVYHNLLYYQIIPEIAAPCSKGVSCSTTYIQWLGFINIPLLSLFAFSLILILVFIIYLRSRKSEK